MVFPSVCVCAGETCGGDDAAAICIVNVVDQQQEHQHQQQRNGAVSILVAVRNCITVPTCGLPRVYNEI